MAAQSAGRGAANMGESHETPGGSDSALRQLLAHYRGRTEGLEEDLAVLSARVESCRVSHSEQHKTEWRLQQLEKENVRLQAAADETRLRYERERAQKEDLQAEVDRLVAQEAKDLETIRFLLSLPAVAAVTNPWNQGTTRRSTAHTHRLPDPLEDVTPRNDLGLSEAQRATYESRIESLEQQLARLKQKSSERVAAMEQRLADAEERHKRRVAALQREVEERNEQLKSVRAQLCSSVEESIGTHRQLANRERLWAEERAVLLAAIEQGKEETERIKREAHSQCDARADAAATEAHQLASSYQAQLLDREQQAATLKAEYEAFRQLAGKRLKKLEEHVAKASKDLKNEQAMRKRDKEGYDTDVRNIRREVKDLQATLVRLTTEFVGENADRDILALQEIHEANLRTKHLAEDIRMGKQPQCPPATGEENIAGHYL